MTSTTIRCTTCTSLVPWAPHCPQCGAYLEFAGDPPWRPAPEEFATSEADAAALTPDEDATVMAAELSPEVISARTAGVPDATPATPGPTAPSRGSFAGTIGVLVAGAVISPLIWWSVGAVLGAATAVVFAVWALVLWPRRIESAPPVMVPPTPVAFVEADEVAVSTDLGPPPQVQARPPQALARRTVETTRPIATRAPEGDVPCPSCSRMNVTERSYCLWCGMPLTDASLAPDTVPVLETEVADETKTNTGQRRLRRGPSRSWYAPIVVLTLLGVVLSTVVFTVFGPGAFRVRFGMTTVYQLINQFIDPYAGAEVPIEAATATTTLRGTTPKDAIGGDATTFWASAPSPQQGAGNELTFTFDGESTINRMVIFPGIQNRILDSRAVATPRNITLTFDDGTTVSEELAPLSSTGDLQQLVRFAKTTTRTVRLTINTVYPPRSEPDDLPTEVALSGIQFLMPPVPPTFLNLPTDVQPRTSLPGMVS